MPVEVASCSCPQRSLSYPSCGYSSTSELPLPKLYEGGQNDPVTAQELSVTLHWPQDKLRRLLAGPFRTWALPSSIPHLLTQIPTPCSLHCLHLHLLRHQECSPPSVIPPLRLNFKCPLLPGAFLPCQRNDFPLCIPSTQQRGSTT